LTNTYIAEKMKGKHSPLSRLKKQKISYSVKTSSIETAHVLWTYDSIFQMLKQVHEGTQKKHKVQNNIQCEEHTWVTVTPQSKLISRVSFFPIVSFKAKSDCMHFTAFGFNKSLGLLPEKMTLFSRGGPSRGTWVYRCTTNNFSKKNKLVCVCT
jgi:hypothetical protein